MSPVKIFLVFPVNDLCWLIFQGTEIGVVCSLYLICCILRIVKIKDLANTVAAALLCHVETFKSRSEAKLNGYSSTQGFPVECQKANKDEDLQVIIPNLSGPLQSQIDDRLQYDNCGSHALRYEEFKQCLPCDISVP